MNTLAIVSGRRTLTPVIFHVVQLSQVWQCIYSTVLQIDYLHVVTVDVRAEIKYHTNREQTMPSPEKTTHERQGHTLLFSAFVSAWNPE